MDPLSKSYNYIKSLKGTVLKNVRDLSLMIWSKGLQTTPYVDIAFSMFLCTPATNCFSERS